MAFSVTSGHTVYLHVHRQIWPQFKIKGWNAMWNVRKKALICKSLKPIFYWQLNIEHIWMKNISSFWIWWQQHTSKWLNRFTTLCCIFVFSQKPINFWRLGRAVALASAEECCPILVWYRIPAALRTWVFFVLFSLVWCAKGGCTGVWWWAPLPQIPAGAFLCGVCMFSLCMLGSLRVLRLPPTKNIHVRLIGVSKLILGVSLSVYGCLSLCGPVMDRRSVQVVPCLLPPRATLS